MEQLNPDNLPKSKEDWENVLRIIKWISAFVLSGYFGGKIIWKVSNWFTSIITAKENITEINESIKGIKEDLIKIKEQFVTEEELKTFKEGCRTERSLDLQVFLNQFIETITSLDAKVNLLLQEKGLIDAKNNYIGIGKRKTDLSRRFPADKGNDD